MKHILLALVLSLAVPAFGTIKGVPFIPEIDSRFDAIETLLGTTAATASPYMAKKVLKATWSFAVNGGGSSADIDLGVTLPANSLITRSFVYVVTQEASNGGTSTTDIYCVAAHDIVNAKTDLYTVAAATTFDGVSSVAASNFKPAASACNVKVRFGGSGDATAGKFHVFLEWVPIN